MWNKNHYKKFISKVTINLLLNATTECLIKYLYNKVGFKRYLKHSESWLATGRSSIVKGKRLDLNRSDEDYKVSDASTRIYLR